MSSDSAKENASVVDSSVSEWKQDIGNSDDPGGDSVSSVVSKYHVNYAIVFYVLFVLYLQ